MDLDYKRDMSIDQDALDIEWLRQPELGRKYAQNATSLRKAAHKADEKVKVVKSELVREANEDPKRCTGKDKPTAADIEAYYRTHPRHKTAKNEWIEAEYEASYAELAQKEISYSRKASLENLVELYKAQYFAGPTLPRDLSREWELNQKREASNERVHKAMKREK